MSMPTDAAVHREFRTAGRVMTAIAAVFFAAGGIAVAVAMPDEASAPAASVPAASASVASVPAVSVPAASAQPPDDGESPFVVAVTTGEFFFAPERITVPAGRLVRFEVSNPGVVPHEFLIGDRHAQDAAEKAMRKGGASAQPGHTHDDSASIYLEAGAAGVVEAIFANPGELIVGCHVPGHYASGMKGTFTVTAD